MRKTHHKVSCIYIPLHRTCEMLLKKHYVNSHVGFIYHSFISVVTEYIQTNSCMYTCVDHHVCAAVQLNLCSGINKELCDVTLINTN